MKQKLWIVRCKMPEGHWVYLDEYASWMGESGVKSKLYFQGLSEGSRKTADAILQENNWEIFRIDFDDE